MNIWTCRNYAQDLHKCKPDKITAWSGDVDTPREELLVADRFWEKESWLSLRVWLLLAACAPVDDLTPQSMYEVQNIPMGL